MYLLSGKNNIRIPQDVTRTHTFKCFYVNLFLRIQRYANLPHGSRLTVGKCTCLQFAVFVFSQFIPVVLYGGCIKFQLSLSFTKLSWMIKVLTNHWWGMWSLQLGVFPAGKFAPIITRTGLNFKFPWASIFKVFEISFITDPKYMAQGNGI